MGTMIFKPVSDVNTSSDGDWKLSNSKLTYAAHLNSFDNEYIYFKSTSDSGSFTLQMALDESSLTVPSFQVTNIRATGVYSAGENLTSGTLSLAFDFCDSEPTNPLEFNITLEANQTNKTFSVMSSSWTASGSEGNSVSGWSPLTLQVIGSHTASGTNAKKRSMSLDQLAIEIDYEPLPVLYIKQNGSWVQCSNVYKKVNGAWVEQSADFLGTSNISSLYYKGG